MRMDCEEVQGADGLCGGTGCGWTVIMRYI